MYSAKSLYHRNDNYNHSYEDLSEYFHYTTLQALLHHDGINVNAKDHAGKTALMHSDNVHVLRQILAHESTDVNIQDDEGNTMLILAAISDSNMFFAPLLYARGINRDIRNHNGQTALDCNDDLLEYMTTDDEEESEEELDNQ